MSTEVSQWEFVEFGILLLLSGALLGYYVWVLLEIQDVKNDYVNPIDCCESLNYWHRAESICLYGSVGVCVLCLGGNAGGKLWTLLILLGDVGVIVWNHFKSNWIKFDSGRMFESKYLKWQNRLIWMKCLVQIALLSIILFRMLWYGIYQLAKAPLSAILQMKSWLP